MRFNVTIMGTSRCYFFSWKKINGYFNGMPTNLAWFVLAYSSHSQVSSEGEDDSGQQSEDGEENGTALGLDLLSRDIPEEKALSDSEIKVEPSWY